MSNLEKGKEDLTVWLKDVRVRQIGHQRAAAHYLRQSRLLGLLVVIFSAITGASAFGSLNSSNIQIILVIVGSIGIASTVLSATQAFLNYPELTARHQIAGIKYQQIRRCINEILDWTTEPEKFETEMKAISKQIGKLEDKSPVLEQRYIDIGYKFVDLQTATERESIVKGK